MRMGRIVENDVHHEKEGARELRGALTCLAPLT